MDAKDFLRQLKKLDCMIENKLVEKQQWKAIALGTTSNNDSERVQTSSSKQKMADAVGRYIDIEKEVDACIDRLVDTKKDVMNLHSGPTLILKLIFGKNTFLTFICIIALYI